MDWGARPSGIGSGQEKSVVSLASCSVLAFFRLVSAEPYVESGRFRGKK